MVGIVVNLHFNYFQLTGQPTIYYSHEFRQKLILLNHIFRVIGLSPSSPALIFCSQSCDLLLILLLNSLVMTLFLNGLRYC